MGRRRWPWWKTLAVVVGSVVLLMAAAVGWIAWRTNVAWAALDARIEEHLKIERSRPPRRPLLHAITHSEDAWPYYLQAVQALEKERFDGWREKEFYDGDLIAEMAGWRLLREHAGALEAFGRGTRCTSLLSPFADPFLGAEPYPGWPSWKMFRLAAIDAWLKCEAGREDEAAERVVDILQFGRDLSEDRGFCGAFSYQEALYWAERPVLRLVRCPWLRAETRECLERALMLLEENPPDAKALLRRHTIRFGNGIRRYGTFTHLKDLVMTPDEQPEWQKVSVVGRFFGVRAFRRMEDFVEFAPPDARSPWPENLRTRLQKMAFVEKGVVPNVCPWLDDSPYRNAQARVRLLRMALQSLAGQPVQPLEDPEDPHGRSLRVLARDGALHLWSVGDNGVDDGGPDAPRNRDIVITIPAGW